MLNTASSEPSTRGPSSWIRSLLNPLEWKSQVWYIGLNNTQAIIFISIPTNTINRNQLTWLELPRDHESSQGINRNNRGDEFSEQKTKGAARHSTRKIKGLKGQKSHKSIGIIKAVHLKRVTKALCFCRSKCVIEKGFTRIDTRQFTTPSVGAEVYLPDCVHI